MTFVEKLLREGLRLARAGGEAEARVVFEHATNSAEGVGDFTSACLAQITLIEELAAHLTYDELAHAYERADGLFDRSPHQRRLRGRLRACARKLIVDSRLRGGISAEPPDPINPPGTKLKKKVLAYERQLIGRALEQTGGNLTKAAKLLGIDRRHLSMILETRQKGLLKTRKAPGRPATKKRAPDKGATRRT